MRNKCCDHRVLRLVAPVRKIINHPDYDDDNFTEGSDISLLQLESPLDTGTYPPVCLPARLKHSFVGQQGTLCGKRRSILP